MDNRTFIKNRRYWLGEPYWNKGIATIAVKLITDYGLHQPDYIRIHAGVFEYNAGSMKVLIKSGYLKDGIFKKSIVKNGQNIGNYISVGTRDLKFIAFLDNRKSNSWF